MIWLNDCESRDIIYIVFSIFYYCRKIYKDVEKENDGIKWNKEISFGSSKQRDPLLVVEEFKPHFYDLLLTDIYMPNMNGFELCEKILELDVNIKVCFMSILVVNIHALREVILVWFYIEFFVWDRTICKPPDQVTIEKSPYGLSVPLGMRFNLLLYLI